MPNVACPECGAELEGLSSEELLAHRNDHWNEETFDSRVHKEAMKRHGELTALFEDRRAAERRDEVNQDQKLRGY